MFIFHLAAIHCLFFQLKLISLHLSAFFIHQPGAFVIYIIIYCFVFLHLLFFPSTADRVEGSNPETHQITIFLFTAFKKRNTEFGSVLFMQLFMTIWTDIGKSQNIHYYCMFMNYQPSVIAHQKSVENILSCLTFDVL